MIKFRKIGKTRFWKLKGSSIKIGESEGQVVQCGRGGTSLRNAFNGPAYYFYGDELIIDYITRQVENYGRCHSDNIELEMIAKFNLYNNSKKHSIPMGLFEFGPTKSEVILPISNIDALYKV